MGFLRGFAPAVKIVAFTLALGQLLHPAAAMANSCPRRFAALVEDEVSQLRSIRYETAWNKYHSMLAEAPQREKLVEQVRQMAQAYVEVVPEFPTKDFVEFVEKEQVNLALQKSAGATFEQAYARFLAQYEPASLALFENSKGIKNYSRQLFERCGKNPKCYAEEAPKIRTWVKNATQGSCLALSPAAVRELGRDLALSWGVLGAWYSTQTDHKLEDFPFAFIANGLFWSTVFAEKSCRKAVSASQKLPFGRAIVDSTEASWWKRGITAAKEEVGEWKWYPIMATTSVGLAFFQNQIFDNEKTAKEYGLKWSFMVLYNSISGPIRRVLVVDPIFKRTFPELKRWLEGKVSAGKMAELVTRTTSAGTDYGIRYKEWAFWSLAYAQFLRLSGHSQPKEEPQESE